ncbi:kinase-like protein [Armillaria solidipes]|uniref:Kinase-like protein n=1 Tax=Armillaria solidipes TaxID=1076256 RepID=A0A2H3BN90_9AGAR|nr:kinase-like protein [Armillaria solidipes]
MGGDVRTLVQDLPSGKRYVPLPLAKHILRHVLQGLVQVHSLGVAYTDLKDDNIMFDVDPSLDIPSLLTADPPRLNIPEYTWEGTMQTAVSQPLPSPNSLDDLLTRNFFIADFGSAQIVEPDDRTTDHITPCALRAPETILLGPWNQRVDIWTFGCLIFELITGHNLFEYVPYPDHDLDAAAGHLWQMICFTDDEFEPKQLSWSQRATQYFERTTCYLKQNPPLIRQPLEKSLRNYKVLSEEDVLVTATFMRRCLRLDPDDRPSAEQLLDDPFWVERSV